MATKSHHRSRRRTAISIAGVAASASALSLGALPAQAAAPANCINVVDPMACLEALPKDGNDLEVKVSSDKPAPKVGQLVTYTVSVRNNGPTTSTNGVLDVRTSSTLEHFSIGHPDLFGGKSCEYNGGGAYRCDLGDLITGVWTSTQITVTPLAHGEASVNANVSPVYTDPVWENNHASLDRVVERTTTTTTMTYSAVNQYFGTPVTLSAKTNIPLQTKGGWFTFYDNGDRIRVQSDYTTGVAKYTTTTLNAGTHNIFAVYEGDAKYVGSMTSQISRTILATGSSIAVSYSSSHPVYYQPVTITATVSPIAPGAGVPTGNITFTWQGNMYPAKSVALVNGKASLTFTPNFPGLKTFSVSYDSNNYKPSYLTTSFSVF